MSTRNLGSVVAPGGAAPNKNSHTTATPFAVPRGCRAVVLLTSSNDVTYRVLPDPASYLPFNPAAYVPPFSPQSTVAATASDPALDAGFEKLVRIGDYGCPSVIAIRSPGGATVSVDLAEVY